MSNQINEQKESIKLKCIKEKCFLYFESDNKYFETCQLVSKYILLDKCYGITAIPNKKEEVICKIADLIKEFDCLNELEELIKNNQ